MDDKKHPQRKSPRLPGYDYRQEGAYFVTICTHQRLQIFGSVVNEAIQLSDIGKIAYDLWTTIPEHHTNIILDAYVVMPNHMHGIVFITDQPTIDMTHTSFAAHETRTQHNGMRSRTLGAVIGSYKSAVSRKINQVTGLVAPIVWQSSFHDHIIRNDESLNRIREYVYTNPMRWAEDMFYSSGNK